jgi:hypothetical protein
VDELALVLAAAAHKLAYSGFSNEYQKKTGSDVYHQYDPLGQSCQQHYAYAEFVKLLSLNEFLPDQE